MSPVRVPISRPSSGVSPIEVSKDWPCLTAVMLDPLPRWQVMILSCAKSFFISSAQRRATYSCEVPWKPYLRTWLRSSWSLGLVEGGVKHRDLGQTGEYLFAGRNSSQVGWVVQGCNGDALFDGPTHFRGDQRRV